MGALPFPLLAACSSPRAFGQALKLRAALRVCLVLGLILTATRFADAQTLPVPTLPPAEPTPAEPTPVASPPHTKGTPEKPPIQMEQTAPASQPAWDCSVGVSAGYDTNVLFVPNGPADGILRPRAECARFFRGARGDLRLHGSADGLFYASEDNPVPGAAELGLSGRHELTPNTSLTGEVYGGLGRTETNDLLTEQGVLFPAGRVRFLQATGTVRSQLGTRTSLAVTGTARADAFEAPQLVDSQSLRGSLSLDRQLSEKATLSTEYAAEWMRVGADYLTQFASLKYDRRITTHAGLLLEGGVSHTGQAPDAGLSSTWNFFGGAAAARTLGRSNLLLYLRQEVLPAFGIGGLRLTTRVGVRAAVPLGQRWGLSLDASQSVPHAGSADEPQKASSTDAEGILRRSVGRWFLVGAEARYRRRGPEGTLSAVDSFAGSISFTFRSTGTGALF